MSHPDKEPLVPREDDPVLNELTELLLRSVVGAAQDAGLAVERLPLMAEAFLARYAGGLAALQAKYKPDNL